MKFKEEWLRYCGLNDSPEQEAIRDWVARLCDIETPNDQQNQILDLAGIFLTSMDLPSGAFDPNKLFDAVKADMATATGRSR
ncbi:hypothetical protein BH11PSE3_BH11PSE3_23520 [soil metagenome]